jgi:hypothetical protein
VPDAGRYPSARTFSSSTKDTPDHRGLREDDTMTLHYSSPALDAELAYRREQLRAAGRRTTWEPSRRGSWFRNRRRAH